MEKVVGVMGGMGPAATVDFMSKVIALTPAAKDQGHIRMLVDSNPGVPDRQVALTGDGEDPGNGEDLDPRAERELEKLMAQAENIDENDPRQLGGLMRKMAEITGEQMEPEMEEAVRRLESGEDPEKIEEELGDIFGEEGEDGDYGMGAGAGAPAIDDGLYSY